MKCLCCGAEQNSYLCEDCRNAEVLDKVFHELVFFKAETCTSPYIAELVSQQTEKYAERAAIPSVLALFPVELSEFYTCRYSRITKDAAFEKQAVAFIRGHELSDRKTQRILYDLLDSYLRNDFVKPRRWCDLILTKDNLCCELYTSAGQYYAMVGEYDLADQILNKAAAYCSQPSYMEFLYLQKEKAMTSIQKLKDDTQRYRTKKPYWPTTEERRRAVAMFYDEKGIQYPRIESKPAKTPENEFAPIKECLDEHLKDYCTFWCSETFSLSSAKCIYEIGAAKIRAGEIVDSFESYVRPWDAGSSARNTAAKEAGVPVETIENALDVDLVIKNFFAFVGGDVLVSTGALGNQAKLLCRAARYAGMREIESEYFDLLDMAADTSTDFDLSNNTREFLLAHFSLTEGKSALEKAKINKKIYEALEKYGD